MTGTTEKKQKGGGMLRYVRLGGGGEGGGGGAQKRTEATPRKNTAKLGASPTLHPRKSEILLCQGFQQHPKPKTLNPKPWVA